MTERDVILAGWALWDKPWLPRWALVGLFRADGTFNKGWAWVEPSRRSIQHYPLNAKLS